MAYKQLTLEQRYQIRVFLKAGFSISSVAKELRIHRSTAYREIQRNRSQRSYNPAIANEKALLRRKYSEKRKLLSSEMKRFIRDKLKAGWSPEQIYGYCKKNTIDMISHESIYKYIAKNKIRGGVLYKQLRRGTKRKRKYGSLRRAQNIKNRTSIDDRPKIVETRSRIGDWEADLVIGKNHKGALLTVVDRCSRYTLAKLLPNKKANVVAKAIIELLHPVRQSVHSITVDNGSEFAFHESISKALNTKVYFAHPYASWERGTNENTNGLIRQFIPKKTSFDGLTDVYVKNIISAINRRPRKVLLFECPISVFAESLIV